MPSSPILPFLQRLCSSLEETFAVADEVAASLPKPLPPQTVIALEGELGAGKTHFVRGLVTALGGNPRQVSSPTFVLLHRYDTPAGPVFHIDAYRTRGADDLASIGFDELLDQPGLVVIEWASKVLALLPPTTRHITLAHAGESSRLITY